MAARQQKLKVLEGSDQTVPSVQPVAVVTGGGRGIGRGLVEVLRQRNYRVVVVVRSLADVSDLFTIDPQNILPVRCDVTEPSTEAILGEFLSRQVDKVDLLINNAGFGATGHGITGLDYGELDRVLAVHCHGPIRCVRACLPLLRASTRATVLNISSRFGSVEWVASKTVPSSGATYAYRIAKAAMNMLTACMSIELESAGIRVLSVDPGKVKTRFGPQDADTEPLDSARAIVDLAENTTGSGLFIDTCGEKLPW